MLVSAMLWHCVQGCNCVIVVVRRVGGEGLFLWLGLQLATLQLC